MSVFLKHNISASAGRDILEMMRMLSPESLPVDFTHDKLWRIACGHSDMKEYDYCDLCGNIFPLDHDLFTCQTDACNGLQYMGPLSKQKSKGRQPRSSFIIADTRKQFTSLLQAQGKLSGCQTEAVCTFYVLSDYYRNTVVPCHCTGDAVQDLNPRCRRAAL